MNDATKTGQPPRTHSTQGWWTAEQVAEYYQMPLSMVWKRIRQKVIVAKNVGTRRCPRYRISAQEIRRFDSQMAA